MKDARRWAVALATVALVGMGLAGVATGIARGDDRTSAAAILDALEHDEAHKAATASVVQQGRDALERATRMRASGDEAHAQLADGLARELAETGRDLVRALDAERMADDARRQATDAGVVGERERALLEEGIARNGRLKAEIDDLGKPQGKEPQTSKLATADAGTAPVQPDKGARPDRTDKTRKTDKPAKAGGGAR
jgi:hypothetical protein